MVTRNLELERARNHQVLTEVTAAILCKKGLSGTWRKDDVCTEGVRYDMVLQPFTLVPSSLRVA